MTERLEKAGALLEVVRARAPRVHCLTNTVVQKFTADGLSALGAVPSMTQSIDEVADFAVSSDALLVNLGTLDPARREAVEAALGAFGPTGKPWTLDPVHCERSPLRLAFARRLLEMRPAVLRGNAAEMGVIGQPAAETVAIRTGAVDRLASGKRRAEVRNGHPTMARVTGTGCLGGALIAAFLAVGGDRFEAAAAALLAYGVSAEIAAERSAGPGSFAVALLDAIGSVTPADILARGRLDDA